MRALLAALALLVVAACGSGEERWSATGEDALIDGDLVAAERAFNRALEAEPRYVPALYGKAWALMSSGHAELRDPARELFQRCIDYDPDFYGGYRGLGVLLLSEGQILPAERYLREAFKRAPEEPSVLQSLAQFYLRVGRLDEALELAEAAIARAPGRGAYLRTLADIHLAAGDLDAALSAIERGRRMALRGAMSSMVLDEGEATVHLQRALVALDRSPPDPAAALAALDLVEPLLDRLEPLEGGTALVAGHRRTVLRLRRRALALQDPEAP